MSNSSQWSLCLLMTLIISANCVSGGSLVAGEPSGSVTTSTEPVIDTPAPATASVKQRQNWTVAEQQLVIQLRPKLKTPFASKANPGDRDTWYVLGFIDLAAAETRSREATMTAFRTIVWRDHREWQRKSVKDATIAHGRDPAAIIIARHLLQPNAALAQLRAPNSAATPGWMKRQATEVRYNRVWVFMAYSTEAEARRFLDNVRKGR